MSYGEAPVKRRLTNLLAVLAGSFALCLVIFCLAFWFLSTIPLPSDMVAMAVLPSGTTLSPEAPDIWVKAVDVNHPLPTLVGYAKDKTGKIVPFAVRVFLISDLTEGWSVWKLVAGSDLAISAGKKPISLFGTPFLRTTQLTIWPKKLINHPGSGFDLPEVLSGQITKNVWHVSQITDDGVGLTTVTSSNLTALTPPLSQLLTNYAAANGKTFQIPENGLVGWNLDQNNLNLMIQPKTPINASTLLGLAEGYDLFDYRNVLLEDETNYQILNPPVSLSATSTVFQQKEFAFQIPNRSQLSSLNKSVSSLACPGQPVAFFDNASLTNICTWIGICYTTPRQLVITQQVNGINFCWE
jgi:hypothetical protein